MGTIALTLTEQLKIDLENGECMERIEMISYLEAEKMIACMVVL